MKRVIAFGIADSIDIKGVKQVLELDLLYSDAHELFYASGEDSCVYIFNYGIVCFFNYREEERGRILELIRPHCRNVFTDILNEEYEVITGPLLVGYNRIQIPSYHPDLIRIIMFNVSQSVALDYYSGQTDRLLEDTNYHTSRLEANGRLGIGGRALKKYIGKTLNLKNRIAANLYVFDSPPQTWENEQLDILHHQLKRSFDLQDRFRDMSEGLGIVKENLNLFKDLLQYRNSTVLEWIIIILIAIEVLHFLFNEIFR